MKQVGRYTLLSRISTGSLGDVFLSRREGSEPPKSPQAARSLTPPGDGEELAAKLFKSEYGKDLRIARLLFTEAPAAVRFRHRAAAWIGEIDRDGPEILLAMEHVHGQPLSAVLKRALMSQAPLEPALLYWVGAEVASVLKLAHETPWFAGAPAPMIHGGVSPRSIMITYEGEVRLLGLGLGRARLAIPPSAARLPYSAPEVLQGERATTARCDFYSLAVVLYDAFNSRPAFRRATEEETKAAIREGRVPALSPAQTKVAPDLADTLSRLMVPTPEARGDSIEPLERILRQLSGDAQEASREALAQKMRTIFDDELRADRRVLAVALKRRAPAPEGPLAPRAEGPGRAGDGPRQRTADLALTPAASGATGAVAPARADSRTRAEDAPSAQAGSPGAAKARTGDVPGEPAGQGVAKGRTGDVPGEPAGQGLAKGRTGDVPGVPAAQGVAKGRTDDVPGAPRATTATRPQGGETAAGGGPGGGRSQTGDMALSRGPGATSGQRPETGDAMTGRGAGPETGGANLRTGDLAQGRGNLLASSGVAAPVRAGDAPATAVREADALPGGAPRTGESPVGPRAGEPMTAPRTGELPHGTGDAATGVAHSPGGAEERQVRAGEASYPAEPRAGGEAQPVSGLPGGRGTADTASDPGARGPVLLSGSWGPPGNRPGEVGPSSAGSGDTTRPFETGVPAGGMSGPPPLPRSTPAPVRPNLASVLAAASQKAGGPDVPGDRVGGHALPGADGLQGRPPAAKPASTPLPEFPAFRSGTDPAAGGRVPSTASAGAGPSPGGHPGHGAQPAAPAPAPPASVGLDPGRVAEGPRHVGSAAADLGPAALQTMRPAAGLDVLPGANPPEGGPSGSRAQDPREPSRSPAPPGDAPAQDGPSSRAPEPGAAGSAAAPAAGASSAVAGGAARRFALPRRPSGAYSSVSPGGGAVEHVTLGPHATRSAALLGEATGTASRAHEPAGRDPVEAGRGAAGARGTVAPGAPGTSTGPAAPAIEAHAASAAVTSGGVTSGGVTSGGVTSGGVTSGGVTSGGVTSGAVTSGAVTSGAGHAQPPGASPPAPANLAEFMDAGAPVSVFPPGARGTIPPMPGLPAWPTSPPTSAPGASQSPQGVIAPSAAPSTSGVAPLSQASTAVPGEPSLRLAGGPAAPGSPPSSGGVPTWPSGQPASEAGATTAAPGGAEPAPGRAGNSSRGLPELGAPGSGLEPAALASSGGAVPGGAGLSPASGSPSGQVGAAARPAAHASGPPGLATTAFPPHSAALGLDAPLGPRVLEPTGPSRPELGRGATLRAVDGKLQAAAAAGSGEGAPALTLRAISTSTETADIPGQGSPARGVDGEWTSDLQAEEAASPEGARDPSAPAVSRSTAAVREVSLDGATADLAMRRRVGRYQASNVVRRSANAMVFRGKDPNVSRAVLLKVLDPDLVADPRLRRDEWVSLFKREARLVARFSHPALPLLLDAGRDGSTFFIAFAFPDGEPLNAILDRGTPLPPDRIRSIAIDVAAALDHAHAARVVHCDVRAANVLVDASGRARLVDFSMAKDLTGSAHPLLSTNVHTATPEMITAGEYSPRGDQFALGMLLYQLLTGVRPFRGVDDRALADEIASKSPLPPAALDRRVDPELSEIAMRMLEKDPLMRFESTLAAGERLGGVVTPWGLSNVLAREAPRSPPAPAPAPAEPIVPVAVPGGPQVVIVDETAGTDLARRLLPAAGLNARLHHDPDAALGDVKSIRPGLVIVSRVQVPDPRALQREVERVSADTELRIVPDLATRLLGPILGVEDLAAALTAVLRRTATLEPLAGGPDPAAAARSMARSLGAGARAELVAPLAVAARDLAARLRQSPGSEDLLGFVPPELERVYQATDQILTEPGAVPRAPVTAQIVAAVEVYFASAEPRDGGRKMSPRRAVLEVRSRIGRKVRPEVIEALVEHLREVAPAIDLHPVAANAPRLLIAGATRLGPLAQAFEAAGFAIEEAENGHLAWEKLRREAYRAAIVERALPGRDGLALLRLCRAHPDTQQVRFLVLTSVFDGEVEAEIQRAGYAEVIDQSAAIEAIRARLERLLGGAH